MNDGRDNLIPLNQRTKDEQRKITSEGGKASGRSRRQRAVLRDTLNILLSAPVKDKAQKTELKKAGLNPDMSGLVALTLVQKAIHGDMKAMRLLLTAVGEVDPVTFEIASARIDLEHLRLEASKAAPAPEGGGTNFIEALSGIVDDVWSDANAATPAPQVTYPERNEMEDNNDDV